MKKSLVMGFILCIGVILIATSCVTNIPQNEKLNLEGYEITFFDDFDGEELDTTRWRFFNGKVKGREQYLDHNYRGGFYTTESDVIYVKDGALHISTQYKADGKYGEGWYSSWIESSTGDQEIRDFDVLSENYVGFAQKYGYFEARCIAPPAEGLWSAFWLLPAEGVGLTENDVEWSGRDGAEIDVMESQNYFRKKDFVQHVIHNDYNFTRSSKRDKSLIFKVLNMYSEFHTYGVEWTPDKIVFYIDGYKTYETKNVYEDKIMGTPEVPEFPLLSVELAGYCDENGKLHVGKEKDGSESWLGSLENMDKSKKYDFVVDYVKVMQKKN